MATMREVRQDRIAWRPDRDELVREEVSRNKAALFVNYVLTVVETLLLFRFVFKLFDANPSNGFVNFIYDLTAPLLSPFRGIFASPTENGAVFESAAVVAMIVYAIIAYLIVRFFITATGEEERFEYRDTTIR